MYGILNLYLLEPHYFGVVSRRENFKIVVFFVYFVYRDAIIPDYYELYL